MREQNICVALFYYFSTFKWHSLAFVFKKVKVVFQDLKARMKLPKEMKCDEL